MLLDSDLTGRLPLSHLSRQEIALHKTEGRFPAQPTTCPPLGKVIFYTVPLCSLQSLAGPRGPHLLAGIDPRSTLKDIGFGILGAGQFGPWGSAKLFLNIWAVDVVPELLHELCNSLPLSRVELFCSVLIAISVSGNAFASG